MSRLLFLFLVCACVLLPGPAGAQNRGGATASTLLELSKKIDDQNAKIDALSQHILKLEQMMEQGKNAATPATVGVPDAGVNIPTATAVVAPGNTHVVTRGETLTSIAKQYKVGIEELQKFNHIENDRKLQIGQTLTIPGASPAAVPVPSP